MDDHKEETALRAFREMQPELGPARVYLEALEEDFITRGMTLKSVIIQGIAVDRKGVEHFFRNEIKGK